jgi:hypothetical protein
VKKEEGREGEPLLFDEPPLVFWKATLGEQRTLGPETNGGPAWGGFATAIVT